METRYAFVARSLAEAIADGRHPVGSMLPNEFELADQFSVSRSTIRAAMRELEASGLVSRRKSAGTRVEASGLTLESGGFVQTLGSVEAVQQFGAETERLVQNVADVVADDDLALQLGCRPGRRWLRISSLRLVPHDRTRLPICWTDVYIDGAFSEVVRRRMAGHAGIFSTLVEEISGRRIREIRQEISAIGVPAHVAAALRAEPNAHALAIRRQYLQSANTLVEASISVHPADRYRYTARLMRRSDSP